MECVEIYRVVLHVKYKYLQVKLSRQEMAVQFTNFVARIYNSIEEEIQCRITLGNKAFYANQFFFKSRLVSMKSKLKMYWSIIRPIVT
jgi:hypothetical protein